MLENVDNKTMSIISREYDELDNNRKGFKFEYETLAILDNLDLQCDSNPRDWNTWIREQNKHQGYDIKVFYNNKELRVECKFTSTPVYHYSFLRDWYQRDCDVIVTSNIWNVSYSDRQLLKSKGVKLLNIYDLVPYLLKLLYPTIVYLFNSTVVPVIRHEASDYSSEVEEKAGGQAPKRGFVERFKRFLSKIKALSSGHHGRFSRQNLNKSVRRTLIHINMKFFNEIKRRLKYEIEDRRS